MNRPCPYRLFRRASIGLAVALTSCGWVASGCTTALPEKPRITDSLGIAVTALQNREFSYTDKSSGYFYGRTHRRDTSNWFAGWNVNRERILSDYVITVGDRSLNRADATVIVYPHKIVRSFPEGVESLRLFDNEAVISIALDSVAAGTISLALEGEMVAFDSTCGNAACFSSLEAPEQTIGVTTFRPEQLDVTESESSVTVTDRARSGGFLIGLAPGPDSLGNLLERARLEHPEWTRIRESRMERLVGESSYFYADDDSLTAAVRWIQLTLDQLVMHQTGYGIYAGLPWFNDYWGRDLFITLPGAALVSGQFEVAADILKSFAGFQNTDETSPDYGRVPNRLRPDEIIYNTTDGTPRFVIALFEYVRYSGDTSILHDLYAAVERSIEGPLRFWIDDDGYLTHADADTWMDAKLDGRVPWSPRGNRAVDIQSLWYQQLRSGSAIALLHGDDTSAKRWSAVADRVLRSFKRDFLPRNGRPILADRLLPDGTPDYALRPNQLFALDLVEDDSLQMAITRHVWESLVYPWGVASLSQKDDNFHPYHEHWDYYHKDAAYHNGTVWVWNNGIAIQRMLEAHQISPAYELLAAMSEQALVTGAVGSLNENMDALPRPGQSYARRSGTFLQAWSNAEYVRVWYQYFLGVRPNALSNTLTLAPQLPAHLEEVDFRVRLSDGWMSAHFDVDGDASRYVYEFEGAAPTVVIRVPNFEPFEEDVSTGDRLEIVQEDGVLELTLVGSDGSTKQHRSAGTDPDARERTNLENRLFDGVTFTDPMLMPGLKSLSKASKQ